MSKLFTTEEAAEYLRLKPKTLQLWRGQGKGPAYVEPERNVVRYREQDIIDWLLGGIEQLAQDVPSFNAQYRLKIAQEAAESAKLQAKAENDEMKRLRAIERAARKNTSASVEEENADE
jgi:hypothetical protein